MGSGRILGTVALAGSTLLALAGCGSGTHQAVSSAPTGGDVIARLSAKQLVGKSVQTLKDGRSARAAGALTSGGEEISLDLALDTDANCAGTMKLGSEGGFTVVKVGPDLWIKPDQVFWDSHGGQAVAGLVGDRYLKTGADNADFADVVSLCDLDDLADSIGRNADDSVTRGPSTTVRGTPAVTVVGRNEGDPGKLYIAAEGRPYPLRLEKTSGDEIGGIDFSDFGVPVSATEPSPEQSVDLDRLTGGASASASV